MREVVVVAGVAYGVSPDGAAYARRCCDVCSVLCDRVVGRGVCSENSLLKCLEIICFPKLTPRASLEHRFGEGGAFGVYGLPCAW